MPRILTVLFRRDANRDRQRDRLHYLGFRSYWPDGRPVTVGLDAFCQHGQRLFGLNRHLARHHECLIKMILFPVADHEQRIHRLSGHRVRRFYIERQEDIGRIHFMDGTPTEVVFHMHEDEQKVVDWIGLSLLEDGERHWFDFATDLVKPADERISENYVDGNGEPRKREISISKVIEPAVS